MSKVSIEQGLRPFQEALSEAGFTVVEIENPSKVDPRSQAVVVSGMDQNFMGMSDAAKTPVVTAAGRTPQEVVSEVRRQLEDQNS
jgi:hypothetical protein